MFPLKTLPKSGKTPHLTRFLIALCVLAFGAQWVLQVARGVDLVAMYGIVPRCYTVPGSCDAVSVAGARSLGLDLVAALFLHGDIWHLGFNMLFLSVFGGGLEDKIGKIRLALVYFGGGLFASAAHIIFHPLSNAPTIGASGAIAAILGAYFIMQPKGWVLTYLPPIFFFPAPAPLFLVIWMFGQISGALSHFPLGGASQGDNIAWMAHLGGFGAGALYGWRLAPWVKPKAASRAARAR